MIAHVYILSRMPRHVSVFDYEIPSTLSHVTRGSFVKISFRNRVLNGIIASVSDKPLRGIRLKPLLSIEPHITISDAELSFFESLAHELAQSVSSVLHYAIPPLPKRVKTATAPSRGISESLTIPTSEADGILRAAKALIERRRAFVHVQDTRRAAALIACYLREKSHQKCVVVAPTLIDAQRLASHLYGFHPLCLTSAQTDTERFSLWQTFRASKKGLCIGTKPALFSVNQTTTTLFLWKSGHSLFHYDEQNPRCDARMVAEQLAETFQTNLFFLDIMPRVDELASFSTFETIGNIRPHEDTLLIPMDQEHLGSFMGSLLSQRALAYIEQSLLEEKKVLCVYNKKMRARRLFCQSCHKEMLCPMCQNVLAMDEMNMVCVRCHHLEPIVTRCLFCQSTSLKESGFGNQKVETWLKRQFPNTSICLLDKEHPFLDPLASLVITTRFYLESLFDPFHPEHFGVILLLNADDGLYQSDARSVEKSCYQLEEWRSVAYANRAPLIVQTHHVSLFQEWISDPIAFLQKELNTRNAYHHPPLWHRIRMEFPFAGKQETVWMRAGLQRKLRQLSEDLLFQHIDAKKKKYEGLEIRFLKKDKDALLHFFQTMPDNIIIDTQADHG